MRMTMAGPLCLFSEKGKQGLSRELNKIGKNLSIAGGLYPNRLKTQCLSVDKSPRLRLYFYQNI